MRSIRKGYILAPLLSTLWAITIVWCLSVISSFSTGDAFKPNFLLTDCEFGIRLIFDKITQRSGN